MTAGPETIHGSCVLLGADGVLLRGASGAGKSRLGDRLVAHMRGTGAFAAHVADDRLVLTVQGGRLVAEPPAALAGLWERRGEGIQRISHEGRAVVRLLVDLVPETEIARLPEPEEGVVVLCGVRVARVQVPLPLADDAMDRVLAHLAGGLRFLVLDGGGDPADRS
jgi:serine kinase of HPr protein (carbohydrate metabolism regulator)